MIPNTSITPKSRSPPLILHTRAYEALSGTDSWINGGLNQAK